MENDHKLISKILSEYNQAVTGIVLFCLKELPDPLGVKRIIDVLKGNRNAFAVNNDLHQLHTFSALTGFTRDQLSDIFDNLILRGLVSVEKHAEDEEEFALVSITEKGLLYLEGGHDKKVDLMAILFDRDVTGIPDDDQDLYYKLKLARRQLAEEFDFPAFMVCNDDILKEMCLRKPMEANELIRIKGIDEAFVQQYGKQFLYVIRQYVIREKGS